MGWGPSGRRLKAVLQSVSLAGSLKYVKHLSISGAVGAG